MLIIKSKNRYYAFNETDTVLLKTNFGEELAKTTDSIKNRVLENMPFGTGNLYKAGKGIIKNSEAYKATIAAKDAKVRYGQKNKELEQKLNDINMEKQKSNKLNDAAQIGLGAAGVGLAGLLAYKLLKDKEEQ